MRDIEQFIEERRMRWNRLEQLLDVADRSPERDLGAARIQEIVRLYRLTCSDLNEARSYTANPDLLSRLDLLAGRGYRFVYRGGSGRSAWAGFRRLLTVEIPETFRRERRSVVASALSLLVGVAIGFFGVIHDPAVGPRLIPAQFFTESPRDRVARIESSDERIGSLEDAAMFGAQLYTHNIQVSFLAFSVGAVSIVLGLWLLFTNGIILGAVMAMYVADGVPAFFFAWVGPHGALEIPAIVFGGAAGVTAGRALLLPGNRSRAAALREAFPPVWRMMLLSALVLVLAGIIEGSFSQFTARAFPYWLKIGVAGMLFLGLFGWLFVLAPARRESAS